MHPNSGVAWPCDSAAAHRTAQHIGRASPSGRSTTAPALLVQASLGVAGVSPEQHLFPVQAAVGQQGSWQQSILMRVNERKGTGTRSTREHCICSANRLDPWKEQLAGCSTADRQPSRATRAQMMAQQMACHMADRGAPHQSCSTARNHRQTCSLSGLRSTWGLSWCCTPLQASRESSGEPGRLPHRGTVQHIEVTLSNA